MACDDPDEYYSGAEKKKWRLFKKESTSKCAPSLESSFMMRSCSQRGNHFPSSASSSSASAGSSSKVPTFLRSFSSKGHSSSSSSSSNNNNKFPSSLPRSSSVRRGSCHTTAATSPPYPNSKSSSSPTLIRSFSKKGTAFTRKWSTLAKEQKARFYIMKRCVTMLVSCRKDRDS